MKETAPLRKNNYQGQDSNLHVFRHQILSLARLPIPPPWPQHSDFKVRMSDFNRRPKVQLPLSQRQNFYPSGAGPDPPAGGDVVPAVEGRAAAAAAAAAFFFAAASAASVSFASTSAASTG
jgi:hypothetical protein